MPSSMTVMKFTLAGQLFVKNPNTKFNKTLINSLVADTRSQLRRVLHTGHSYLLQRQTVKRLITLYHQVRLSRNTIVKPCNHMKWKITAPSQKN